MMLMHYITKIILPVAIGYIIGVCLNAHLKRRNKTSYLLEHGTAQAFNPKLATSKATALGSVAARTKATGGTPNLSPTSPPLRNARVTRSGTVN